MYLCEQIFYIFCISMLVETNNNNLEKKIIMQVMCDYPQKLKQATSAKFAEKM